MKPFTRSCAIALLALVLTDRSIAQSWQVFDMATAGFPSNTINGIAEDGQGTIWASTDWGLCRYDGSAWTIFQTSNSGIPENTLTCVAVDTLDRVWVGTIFHGAVMFDGATWTEYNTGNSSLPDNEVLCITIDHRGWAWIGTYVGLACKTGSGWRLYDDTPASYNGLVLNGPVIKDVAVRSDSLVMIATENGGFHYLTDTMVQVHSTYIDFFPDNSQTAVVFDETANERWVSTPAQGLLRQGGYWFTGPWFQYAPWTSAMPTAAITDVALDALGRPWCGSISAGLIRRNFDGTYTVYDPINSGLPDEFVTDVLIAGDGSIWAGTQTGGLARLDLTVGMPAGPSGVEVRAYPNPTDDLLFVEVPSSSTGPMEWTIRNSCGQRMMQGTLEPGERRVLDIDGLIPGQYVLSAMGAGASTHLKLLVQ